MLNLSPSNAPCSWGVEFADAPNNPNWWEVLDELVLAGYQATELGPYGFLPVEANKLKDELSSRNLSIVAGTLFKHFHRVDLRDDILRFAKESCQLLQAVNAHYMVLIDHVSSPRTDQAGQMNRADRLPLEQWKNMMKTIDECARVCLSFGITPVLHPHTGTYIEYRDETDRAMNDLHPDRVKLCVDTGHCYYAGMEPAKLIRDYAERVVYLHFKDVNSSMHQQVVKESIGFYEAVSEGVFCPLGEGSVDFNAVYSALQSINYQGWVTVEQDTDPTKNSSPLENAIASLDFIRSFQ